MSDLLVIVDDVAHVVAAVVVSLAHAHGVVGEVDIAVVAEEFRHLAAVRPLRSLVFVFGPVSTCVRSWLVDWLRGKLAWLGWLASVAIECVGGFGVEVRIEVRKLEVEVEVEVEVEDRSFG